jgi:multidrug/hemolysin transport system permease protein
MQTLIQLVKRNIKLYFKDKGMFFTSMITPAILLVLYVTFLANVYNESFEQAIPEGVIVSNRLIKGLVGGEMVSSLLAVSCVTVSFCANFVMVQDKVSGVRKDLLLSPVKKWVLSLSYYIATLFSSLMVCFAATALCFIYLAAVGWFLSFTDVVLMIIDVMLLSIFGTALSSVIYFFVSSQGQRTAIATIVSSGYGFICGAYMPISQYGTGLQNVLSLLPGTYGTSLIRNHAVNGALNEMIKQNFPTEVIEKIKDSIDCNIKFFGSNVSIGAMYIIVIAFIIALVGIYVGVNFIKPSKKPANRKAQKVKN